MSEWVVTLVCYRPSHLSNCGRAMKSFCRQNLPTESAGQNLSTKKGDKRLNKLLFPPPARTDRRSLFMSSLRWYIFTYFDIYLMIVNWAVRLQVWNLNFRFQAEYFYAYLLGQRSLLTFCFGHPQTKLLTEYGATEKAGLTGVRAWHFFWRLPGITPCRLH